MNDRWFVKLYVKLERSDDELLALIAAATSGQRSRWDVEGMGCYWAVDENDEYDPDVSNDFLFFPFTVDVEPTSSSMNLETFLEAVATVMQACASAGGRVVAACDWEDRLPGHGRLGC